MLHRLMGSGDGGDQAIEVIPLFALEGIDDGGSGRCGTVTVYGSSMCYVDTTFFLHSHLVLSSNGGVDF